MAKKNNTDMVPEESQDVEMKTTQSRKSSASTAEASAVTTVEEKNEVKEKRPPQMVTENGDKVTHGHVFKSNTSDDWFFTAKINGVPLKPQRITPEDTEAFLGRTMTVQEAMEKYYPTKVQRKLSDEEFKIPTKIMTSLGEQTVHKFNVYKEKNMDSVFYGQYRFYAQVGERRMSEIASRQDLNAYFDKTEKPATLITKVFGDKLNMPEYYKQFQLPEGSGITEKDIRLMKNQETNRYEISAMLPDGTKTPSREISYDDRQSYFSHKVASKEQLAAKYLNEDITTAMKTAPKKEMERQPSLGL